jgi:hypothetical protein
MAQRKTDGLLEALKAAEHYLSRFYALAVEQENDPCYAVERDAISQARAAIAKAKGGAL